MQRQRQPHRKLPRPGMKHVKSAAVRGINDLAHFGIGYKLEQPQAVGCHAKRLGRFLKPGPARDVEWQNGLQHQRQIWLIKGAGSGDQIAQMRYGLFAVAGKPFRGFVVQPAAVTMQPAR